MSISTDFDMQEYFGTHLFFGQSVRGYDVFKIERIISNDLAIFLENYKKEDPEPDDESYDDFDEYEEDYCMWSSRASTELSNYLEEDIRNKWDEVFESNYHPIKYLAEIFNLKEEDAADAVGDIQLEPLDLDFISGMYYFNRDTVTVDHIRDAIAQLPRLS